MNSTHAPTTTTITLGGKDYIVSAPEVGYHYSGYELVGRQVTVHYNTTRDGKPFGPARWVGTANPGKGVGAKLLVAAFEEFGLDQVALDHMIAEAS